MTFVPLILLACVFVAMLLSQRNRVRSTNRAQAALTVGDEVRTTSGLYGTLVELDDATATLEASPGVALRFDRRAVLPTETADAGAGAHPVTDDPEDEVK